MRSDQDTAVKMGETCRVRDPPRVERELVQLARRVAHLPHRAVQPVQQRVDALLGVLVLAHLARLREVAVDVRAVLGGVPVVVLERAVEAREGTGDEAEGADGELQAEIDTSAKATRRALVEMSTGRLAEVFDWQRRFGMPILPLSAGEETLPQMRRLLGLGPR